MENIYLEVDEILTTLRTQEIKIVAYHDIVMMATGDLSNISGKREVEWIREA